LVLNQDLFTVDTNPKKQAPTLALVEITRAAASCLNQDLQDF
jgi:hypothetical protein